MAEIAGRSAALLATIVFVGWPLYTLLRWLISQSW